MLSLASCTRFPGKCSRFQRTDDLVQDVAESGAHRGGGMRAVADGIALYNVRKLHVVS